jgi:serine/threonine-protein kinase
MCWGLNLAGQAAPTVTSSPVVLPESVNVTGATALAGTSSHTCALASGQVWCWGVNDEGELGPSVAVGPNATHLGPVRIDLPARSVAVGAGAKISCALLETGAVHCWGRNVGLALGRGEAGPPIDEVEPNPGPVAL